ncbi:hypothetical protein K683_0097 [Campylobacter jejuni HB-CJGB-LC]|nr:hypothetical protein K683_0097 [Campylobacter jejuni HB-CJGB-LC]
MYLYPCMQESRRLFSKVKQKLHCEIVYFLNFKEKAQKPSS